MTPTWPISFDKMVRLFREGGTVWCTVCHSAGHATPECLPCRAASHCGRRGPHDSCLYDHARPGGVFYTNPQTGRSPLDEATLFATARRTVGALHNTLERENEQRAIAADRELARQMRDAGIPLGGREEE